ncbi:hypothetical protein [Hyphomonas jannaschiana]|uniref:Lipoprotein n=1 Tax=Hyphomonas jannaschiana VP2 TaxID=1280952 RepID=A0A059F6F9_9PROT|nr:hypothetical protein [Hyphomonas jannaschiana]KCZ83862.1 hypothetical protein HJA_16265 [Hyphomonas jannaschiana VP2]
MTRAFLCACLLAGLFSGPALAQEDYTSPLAGIKSIDDLVNGAGAPEEANEDDGAFDGLWFDDAGSDGAQQRAAALVEAAGWVCDAWPMEGGDPMRTQMFAAFMDNGDLFIREENFASMDGQTLQVTIEYTADVVTDETETEVTVGTKSSKVTGVTGLPEGVSLNDPGPVELTFQVAPADNPMDGYVIQGFSEAGGETSMLTCIPGE